MSKLTGVVDEPVRLGGPDKLGIEVLPSCYQVTIKSLPSYYQVYWQSEHPDNYWGSGRVGKRKTSLIHSIYHHFDSRPEKKELQIWINSWEYSLLSNPEEALLKIINKILADLLEADGDIGRGEKLFSLEPYDFKLSWFSKISEK